MKKYVRQNIQHSWIKKILIIFSERWIPVMIKFPYNHFDLACWAIKGIHSESYVHLSLIKWIFWHDNIFLKRVCSLFKFIRNMPWIETVPVYHFKIFRWQMNQNMRNKFFIRHCNVSFLFIISQIIKKESDFVISNVLNLIFGNRRTCEVSSKILDNTFCTVISPLPTLKKIFCFICKVL